jgi:hypothetical protein
LTTKHTLTGDLGTILDTEARSVFAKIRTNLTGTDAALVDLDAGVVMMRGSELIPLDSGRTFALDLIATNSTGTNITDDSLRYCVDVTWYDATGQMRTWTSGFFEHTTDADLSSKAGSSAGLPAVPAPAPSTIDSATATNLADEGSQTRTAFAAALDDELGNALEPITDVIPNGIIEGRALFQYGPSRGVGVTAQRIHYNRLRRRIGSGFFFNGSVGGHLAADTAALMYGTIATTSRQGGGDNEWSPSVGASTFVNKAMQAAVFLIWPFGNDAAQDGRADRNSTTAKARASAKNALRAIVALVRAETRIESVLNGVYTTTSGSPNITVGVGSPWYKGMLVQGAGIPANTYVGDMINGGLGGFKLSSSRTSQVDVNATASASGVTLTFSPVYTGTWATVTNTAFSSGNMVKTNADAATSTYVIHLTQERRVLWVTAGVDDAEYAGTKGAPFGGTGGAGYSIVVDGGAPIVGTTSNEHRFGALDQCHGQKVVDLGPLAAGVHTITITSVGASKLLVDEGLLIESLTPPTVLIMKEVELPAAYYAQLAAYGASYARTQTYNGFIDDEVAHWPADESVITHDITADGYDKAVHISAADGAYAHFNDPGERLAANGILKRLNQLAARVGLIWT